MVYLFSIFHGEVIASNLGSYQADMTISPTALNQSNLFKYFSINKKYRSSTVAGDYDLQKKQSLMFFFVYMLFDD